PMAEAWGLAAGTGRTSHRADTCSWGDGERVGRHTLGRDAGGRHSATLPAAGRRRAVAATTPAAREIGASVSGRAAAGGEALSHRLPRSLTLPAGRRVVALSRSRAVRIVVVPPLVRRCPRV